MDTGWRFCLKYPMDQWIINQEINSNIIKWWSNSQNTKSKIVIIGTSCVMMREEILRKKII